MTPPTWASFILMYASLVLADDHATPTAYCCRKITTPKSKVPLATGGGECVPVCLLLVSAVKTFGRGTVVDCHGRPSVTS
jgi:hypothetical protein